MKISLIKITAFIVLFLLVAYLCWLPYFHRDYRDIALPHYWWYIFFVPVVAILIGVLRLNKIAIFLSVIVFLIPLIIFATCFNPRYGIVIGDRGSDWLLLGPVVTICIVMTFMSLSHLLKSYRKKHDNNKGGKA